MAIEYEVSEKKCYCRKWSPEDGDWVTCGYWKAVVIVTGGNWGPIEAFRFLKTKKGLNVEIKKYPSTVWHWQEVPVMDWEQHMLLDSIEAAAKFLRNTGLDGSFLANL